MTLVGSTSKKPKTLFKLNKSYVCLANFVQRAYDLKRSIIRNPRKCYFL